MVNKVNRRTQEGKKRPILINIKAGSRGKIMVAIFSSLMELNALEAKETPYVIPNKTNPAGTICIPLVPVYLLARMLAIMAAESPICQQVICQKLSGGKVEPINPIIKFRP